MWDEVVNSRVAGDLDINMSAKEDHRPVLVEFCAVVGTSLATKGKGENIAAINLSNARDAK